MRLLLINPNTSPAITDLVVAAARAHASPGTAVAGATGRFGARYIASRAAAAVAAHAALDAYAEHGEGADAIVLACFGEPGLGGLRELAAQPVVGFAESACRAAAQLGGRFAIVTGGERWGPMLEEFVAWLGLAERLAAVRTVAPTGADIARDPDAAVALLAKACNDAVRDDGARAVILGGAGLAGLAARVAPLVGVPLVDPVETSVRQAEALAARFEKPARGDYAAAPPVDTAGLAAPLARLFTAR